MHGLARKGQAGDTFSPGLTPWLLPGQTLAMNRGFNPGNSGCVDCRLPRGIQWSGP